jgi:hypothetical protein
MMQHHKYSLTELEEYDTLGKKHLFGSFDAVFGRRKRTYQRTKTGKTINGKKERRNKKGSFIFYFW